MRDQGIIDLVGRENQRTLISLVLLTHASPRVGVNGINSSHCLPGIGEQLDGGASFCCNRPRVSNHRFNDLFVRHHRSDAGFRVMLLCGDSQIDYGLRNQLANILAAQTGNIAGPLERAKGGQSGPRGIDLVR